MSDVQFCDFCRKPAAQKCANCQTVFYCSKEHQKSGWKKHKHQCHPFTVSENEVFGRHLVATRTIKNGEVVLKEPPLIWGPQQTTPPVCLGCGKLIDEKNNVPCDQCGWPMCSKICHKAPCHIPECRYTVLRGNKVSIKNFGIIHPTYQCVLVLRCLYQKQFLPEVWKELDGLESHCEQRKRTLKYENERIYVAEFIRRFFKMDTSDDDILRICGIIMVNGHELPLSEPPQIAIYKKTSMLEHSCRANCGKSFSKDGSTLIVAGRAIEKGEHLSICYTDPLWTTPNRRHHLNETKFFLCSCERCTDPSEFGTNFSALKCQKNCEGVLLPASFANNPNKADLAWSCSKCKNKMSSYSVHDLLEKLGNDLSNLRSDNEELKKYLSCSGQFLSEDHSYMSEVRWALAQSIGQDAGLSSVGDEEISIKINLCKKLLNIFEMIAPAERRLIGLVLFELHAGMAELLRRNGPKITPELISAELMETRKILERCLCMLKHEPSVLPEGKIYKQGKKNLEEINKVLKAQFPNVNT